MAIFSSRNHILSIVCTDPYIGSLDKSNFSLNLVRYTWDIIFYIVGIHNQTCPFFPYIHRVSHQNTCSIIPF